jgi:hypothetical protein
MSADAAAARRLEATLELWADGVTLQRERLRRERPQASEAELAAALAAWLEAPITLGEDLALGTWPRTPTRAP